MRWWAIVLCFLGLVGRVWAYPILEWEPMGVEEALGQVWRDPYLGMEFVWVPGGCFEMGCGEWTSDCERDEYPVHEVCVDGFWMGRYEVTVGQWRRFLRETGYNWNEWDRVDKYAPGDDHPVVRVSWHDAKAFAEWLSRKTGYKFRLPTEAEWEYACRSGGKKVTYGTATGEISHDLANYVGTGGRDRWEDTSPVGSFPPNPLGLYDMTGNVYEWCEDWYDENYYARSPRINPRCPGRPGSWEGRVQRGGAFNRSRWRARCARRWFNGAEEGNWNVGFRLVRPAAGHQ